MAIPLHGGTSQSRYIGLSIGLVFLIFNGLTFRQAYLLKHSGVPVQGVVGTMHLVKHRGSVSYSADYSYTVSGTTYQGTADIVRESYLALRPGASIKLRYVDSNPSISEAWDMGHSNTTIFLTLFMGIPVSVLILVLAFRQHGSRPELLGPLSDELISELDIALPNMVKGFAFTMYPVIDMPRARHFYETDLGLKAAKDYKGEWVEYHLWHNCFALTTLTDVKPSAEAGGSIALEVQNVDDFVKDLRQKGIRIKKEPFSTHVCRMAVVVDPEGNALTLHQRTRAIRVSE